MWELLVDSGTVLLEYSTSTTGMVKIEKIKKQIGVKVPVSYDHSC